MQNELGRGNKKVVVLRPVNEGRYAHTVRQEDLVELLLLSREFSEARRRWEKKRDWLRAALRGGAAVEPGALTAELVRRQGGGYEVEIYEYETVVVK